MNRLLFFTIVSLVGISGEALICYQCFLCNDITTAKNVAKKNCSKVIPPISNPVCFKMDYVLSNGTTGISARGCSPAAEVYSVSLRANYSHPSILSQSVYHCNDKDLCNNSESLHSTSSIIFITIVTFICAIKNFN